ncbi:5419_t:CDS:2 [Paraglomus occultum]|uniref:5419_t:CDS:1 n=1 Tax=Paraglomus occultum TaxID=144539 RepID=A0A9N9C5W2_9GLOM|nr:5419_t:CDS:2 [Paraglomus occultum]
MFLIIYPTVGTILVSIAAIKRRAVRITEFSCLVLDPLWVRLLGYNGPNTVLAIFSIYFACHATLVVIRHLYKFNPQPFPIHQEADEKNAKVETEADSSETQSSGKAIVSDSNESQDHTLVMQVATIGVESTSCDSSKSRLSRTVSSTPALKTRNNRYKVTRAVIIRMTIFISTYALVNINASIGVILTIIKREPVETGDLYVCGTVGILMCLVFGTTDKAIDRLGLKWVPDIQLCSRIKVFKKKNEQNI